MASFNKKTIEDIYVSHKKVIVRVDFNVPLDGGNITDDRRIVQALPTIKYLINKKAKVILMSHLGRPKGKVNLQYSMKPVEQHLASLLPETKIILADDVIGEDAFKKANELKEGQILLLENLRFHAEEEANDEQFAKKLASLANNEIYVNDAFGTAHRAHASTEGIGKYCKVAACGFLIKSEIEFMGRALSNPARPFVAILGGAKISDKIGVIENLLNKVDVLIIGGGMAYTFFRANGYTVGQSICEYDKVELASDLMKKAREKGVKLLLPIDNVVSKEFSNDSEYKTINSDNIPEEWMSMDIGPKTIQMFSEEISKAETVIWNGPMGVFEFANFAVGTREVAKAVANSSAVSIVGGGDSAAALEQLGFADKISHISTGGGASLEFLEGKVLPGIETLMDK